MRNPHLIDKIHLAENKNQEQIRFRNLLMFVLGVNIPHKTNDFLCLKYRDLFDENDNPRDIEYELNRNQKNKTIQIPLRRIVRDIMVLYVNKYGLCFSHNADDYLFQSRKHQVVSVHTWWDILRSAANAVGINKNVGAETVRKTYGLNIYNLAPNQLNALLFLGEIWGQAREYRLISYLNLTEDTVDFDYYFGESFSLGYIDLSRLNI